MFWKRLMTVVVALVLLGAFVGCAGDLESPPEVTNTLERTVEEAIVVLHQPAGEANTLEQPAEGMNTLAIKGWVTVDAYHYDAVTGTYVPFYHHESSNDLVDIGKDWVEDQLGDSPGTVAAQWISLSSNATAPAAGWTLIPDEIAADGLARASGNYTSTGVGAWEIEASFDATGPHTAVQLTGLQWEGTPGGNDTLFAANTFTAVTLSSGDRLTITWQLSIS